MASPKLNKHYMVSPPIANSARFRSPGIVRRNMTKDPGYQSAQFAKKARRSKSSEANSRSISSNMMSGKRKLSKDECSVEQHLELLNTRWRMMAKNQEKMTKEEIMNNYKLLLTDHIKLEKFMSLISRENELNRTRLESDLLDSMMVVEELKQALVARDLNRRSKIDPRASEERRELIKQNKKLLHELHESAKKVEKLELSVFELQEQVELKDFQMMEAQNQKIIMEEQLEGRSETKSTQSQTQISSESELENLRKNNEETKDEIETLQFENESLKTENDVLKISEENLQEEISSLRSEIKELQKLSKKLQSDIMEQSHRYVNSKVNDDEDVSRTVISNVSGAGKWNEDDDNSLATDSGLDSSHASIGKNVLSDNADVALLQDTIKMLLSMVHQQQPSIQHRKSNSTNDWNRSGMVKSLYQELEEANEESSRKHSKSNFDNECDQRTSPVGACCSSAYKLAGLEKENRRWKSFVENIGKSDNELLTVIADLEENVRTTKQELDHLKQKQHQNPSTSNESSPQKNGKQHSAEYYSKKLEEIQSDQSEDQMKYILEGTEKAKNEALSQIDRLEEELDSCNRYVEKLDGELTAEKKMELTLRKRIDVLEQRLINGISSGYSNKSVAEMETKILQLETINSSLMEVNSVEKRRMEEQRSRIKELELNQKSLSEQLNLLQMRELSAQKKVSRLQAVYEDLLREYASAMRVVHGGTGGGGANCHGAGGNRKETTTGDNISQLIQENARLRMQLQESAGKLDSMQSLLLRYQHQLYTTNENSKLQHTHNSNTMNHTHKSNNNNSTTTILQQHLQEFEYQMNQLSSRK